MRHQTPIDSFLILLGGVFVLALFIAATGPKPKEILVGYGCEGASGPLYAKSEDHFPSCKNIERAVLK